MMSINVKNKRRYPRNEWPVDATYQTLGEKPTERVVRTMDVSDGGALLSVGENLAVGTRIKVKFHIGDFEIGPEPAMVVRNDSAFHGSESLMAVQFERPHRGLARAVEFDRETKRWKNSKLLAARL
jgi:c-di-GMP-binding flagellar brake protein YcgR